MTPAASLADRLGESCASSSCRLMLAAIEGGIWPSPTRLNRFLSPLVPATRLRTRLRRVSCSVRRSSKSEGGKRGPSSLAPWIPAYAGMSGKSVLQLGPHVPQFGEEFDLEHLAQIRHAARPAGPAL